jgi:hypothetical protein
VSWVRLRRPRACNRCGHSIEVGAPARLGTLVPHVWCERCAWTGLQEHPPAELPWQDLAPLAGSQRELAFDDPSREDRR